MENNKLRIWSRSGIISEAFLNKTVMIYNGKEFKKLFVKREHIGFKFGEFSPTRLFIRHKEKSKNLIKKKK
jgi:small subunit ribosomal protein S19